MRPVIGVTSQVTLSWPPDHVCDRALDSVGFGRQIGWFRAYDERGIAKIGLLTLDQEIEGSNPSSPANLTTCWALLGPTATSCVGADAHQGCVGGSAVPENQAHSY
jgi:hypothetical protein